MTVVVGDFSSRPFRLTVERAMFAGPDVLFRAWTEQFDRWFAAPRSVLISEARKRSAAGIDVGDHGNEWV